MNDLGLIVTDSVNTGTNGWRTGAGVSDVHHIYVVP